MDIVFIIGLIVTFAGVMLTGLLGLAMGLGIEWLWVYFCEKQDDTDGPMQL
jgi:hypothetical protein